MNKDIKCPDCGTLFGKQTNATTIAIKHRDLYRTIIGGQITGPCRGCGRQMTWGAENDSTRTR